MGLFFCKPPQIFCLVFSFFSLISFCFSLSTISISETGNLTLICALLPNQSSLNCYSFQAPGPGIRPWFNHSGSFDGIVSGHGFVCALRSLFSSSSNISIMHCWRFSSNDTRVAFKRIYRGSALTELEASNSHICGLNETNTLNCWQWRDFNQTGNQNFSRVAVGEGFVCGLSEAGNISCLGNIAGQPSGNFSVIAAGFGHACGIRFDNEVKCWGNSEGIEPQGKFKALALGLNRSCAIRNTSDGTVVCWGQNNFSLPVELKMLNFLTIRAKRNVFCGVTSKNNLLCWGDTNFNSSFMPFPGLLPRTCRNGESICLDPLPPAPSPQPPNRDTGSHLNGRLIAFLIVGSVGSLSLLLVVAFFLFRYCKGRVCRVHDSGRLDETADPENGVSNQPQTLQAPAPVAPPPPPVLKKPLSQLTSLGNTARLEEFPLEVLLQATENFSEHHKIGTGSFGAVYHATLDDGREVAIKRAELTSSSSIAAIGTKREEDKDNAFVNELEYLSRLHHKNLVRLLGFCEDCNERVLVYEYINNGTLHDHLHKFQSSQFMSWAIRLQIALDAARGIEYLHRYSEPPIIHRDIKSSNILLDANWTAKVSDFGLSLMGPDDDKSHLSLKAAGTVGYIDPEYYRLQQLTSKSDVYSFGVVLLELLSGYKAIHRNETGTPRHVVDFVVPYINHDNIHRVLDSRVPPPTPFEIDAMAYVGYLAADCVQQVGRSRPSMADVVYRLENALAACLAPPFLFRSSTDSST